jgi:hypothetical protein
VLPVQFVAIPVQRLGAGKFKAIELLAPQLLSDVVPARTQIHKHFYAARKMLPHRFDMPTIPAWLLKLWLAACNSSNCEAGGDRDEEAKGDNAPQHTFPGAPRFWLGDRVHLSANVK